MNYQGNGKGIADAGYPGYLSHEDTPHQEAAPALAKMLGLCQV